MRKLVFQIFIVTSISIYLFSNTYCNSENKEKNTQDTLKILNKRTFSVSDYNFAILENNKFIPYNKAIYHRGDEVFLVLSDVGPFALDKDSLNYAEMKLEVTDAIGQQITLRENLFGERGHSRFINNMLSSPYASYESDLKNKPGKYSMTVTIFDLVKKDSIVVNDDFFLE